MRPFTPTRSPPAFPGTSLLGLKARTLLEVGEAVENGFETETVKRLAKHLNLTLEEALELVQLRESTFHSYQRDKKRLRSEVSTNVYQLAQITEAAEQYFENTPRAHAWLRTPRATFGGKSPLQFALLPGGAEYVTTVLSRLEHGVYT
jgi:putative toxin-antitoxin system antitoxin component (TIGR02293 family)